MMQWERTRAMWQKCRYIDSAHDDFNSTMGNVAKCIAGNDLRVCVSPMAKAR